MTGTMVAQAGDSPARALKIGLLGSGIGGSRTPRMHLAAAGAAGLSYEYHLVDSQVRDLPEDPADILAMLEAEGFDGLNVTYPFKRAVLPLMDELSPAARNVGAVNTVVLRDGRRSGHNTDHWGFGESLRQGLPQAPRDKVLLLGAGGAGGAVAHALLDGGVEQLAVRDVNDQVAADLVALLTEHYGQGRTRLVTDIAPAAAEASGIVNASPVGMEKLPGLPLPEEMIRPDHWVADIVYFPLETELLATARAKGCAVLPGSGMALYQAVRAFGLFTGREADIERMREAFDSFN
ncbi:shikimate dehydrogenase [Pseudooceanicola antarcticus]|uniref:Shikimate dehydrogenase (NADP(+)) n=1 Tax=Pseudooceanicola antarcticus TaxID=1247613 RepID=A0A285IXQ8_9RHOB|nr:shikimate dehydrogenase [Pseudooceanicola antarcticus]PJE25812.1 shikimate dehydrogenase [Pseudooceanicola antarcticus]SNY52752.1 shikimate dehydrogenase [Pseudooceanicola antarcticus]